MWAPNFVPDNVEGECGSEYSGLFDFGRDAAEAEKTYRRRMRKRYGSQRNLVVEEDVENEPESNGVSKKKKGKKKGAKKTKGKKKKATELKAPDSPRPDRPMTPASMMSPRRLGSRLLPPLRNLAPEITQWTAHVTGSAVQAQGAVPVVSAAWFVRHPDLGAPQFQRCQDIPAAGLMPHTMCTEVIYVCHEWDQKGDPDPSGEDAMLLALWLAARYPDLSGIGLWIDYCVLPQPKCQDRKHAASGCWSGPHGEAGCERSVARSELEISVYNAVMERLNDVQHVATREVIVSTSEKLAGFAKQGVHVLELYTSTFRDHSDLNTEPAWTEVASHAVAATLLHAMLNACATVLVGPYGWEPYGDELWTCPNCNIVEAKNNRFYPSFTSDCTDLIEIHQDECNTSAAGHVHPYKATVWPKLERLSSLAECFNDLGAPLPACINKLLHERRDSRLQMWQDLEICVHRLHCTGTPWDKLPDDIRDSRTRYGIVDELKQEIADARAVASRFEHTPQDVAPSLVAEELGMKFDFPEHIDIIITAMRHEMHRKAHDLVQDDMPVLLREQPFALHDAVKTNNVGFVSMLVAARPEIVDSPDSDGWTPLHRAAESGNAKLTQILIDAKADPSVKNKRKTGQTPLHSACGSRNSEVVGLLLAAQANPNIKTKDGRTPLHRAAMYGGGGEAVRLLVEANAEVDARARALTPLHRAARYGHADVVEALVQLKADVNNRDRRGLTALDYAEERGRQAVVELLSPLMAPSSMSDLPIDGNDSDAAEAE